MKRFIETKERTRHDLAEAEMYQKRGAYYTDLSRVALMVSARPDRAVQYQETAAHNYRVARDIMIGVEV